MEVATTGHPLHSVVFERSGIGDIKALISAYASASGAAMGEVVDGFEPRMCRRKRFGLFLTRLIVITFDGFLFIAS